MSRLRHPAEARGRPRVRETVAEGRVLGVAADVGAGRRTTVPRGEHWTRTSYVTTRGTVAKKCLRESRPKAWVSAR